MSRHSSKALMILGLSVVVAAAGSLVGVHSAWAQPGGPVVQSGDLPLNLFDLPSGATIVVQFDTTIAAGPFAAGTTQVCNQATVGSEAMPPSFADLLTGDPDATGMGDPNDATCTPLDVMVDLACTKGGPSNVDVESNFSYTIDVSNSGAFGATMVSVVDTLPAGVAYDSFTGTGWTCTEMPMGTVTCTRTTLEVGAAPQITLNVTAPSASGTGTNMATVGAAETDSMGPNDCSVMTTFDPISDLSIVKGGPATVDAGATYAYTLDVSNAGPSTATSVQVVDMLPAGVTYDGFTGTNWTCVEAPVGTVTCDLGVDLGVASAPQITLNVTAPAEGGVVTNTATATATESDPTTPNTSSVMTTVTAIADLTIVKGGPATVDAGAMYTYTLDVSNAGPSTATSVQVVDMLPAGVTYDGFTGTNWTCVEAPVGTVTCDLGVDLGVASAPQITLNVTAPDEGGVVTNTATATATESDPTTPNTSSVMTTVTAIADLTIVKGGPATVDAAAMYAYTLDVSNAGPSTATSVQVVDTLPVGVTFDGFTGTNWTCVEAPAGTVTCDLGVSLAVGAAPQITLNVTAPDAGGVITNTATATATESDPTTPNTSSVMTTVTAIADLTIVKDGPATVDAEAMYTYTLDVSNAGPSTATGVQVVDTLPAGVTFDGFTGTNWTCVEAPAGTVTCDLGVDLAIGAAPQITLNVTAPTATGLITNTAVATANEDDPTTPNSDTADTDVLPIADLSITKTDSADPPPGTTLDYTLAVENLGPSDATGVQVVDTLPAGVSFDSFAGTGWVCVEAPIDTVTCDLAGTLTVGPAATLTITVTIDPAPPMSITNTATVASDFTDPDPVNNTDTEDTTLDVVPPTVVNVDTVSGTGDGTLDDCETTFASIQQLVVTFSEAVFDPTGDTDPDDVTNPDNYLLISGGPDLTFDTTQCGPALGDDVEVGVLQVSATLVDHDSDPGTPDVTQATADLDVLTALDDGQYRLLICGSTSIVDPAGNALDGDGDGNGGDDYQQQFRVDTANLFANGHFDCDLDGWDATSEFTHNPSTDGQDSPESGSAHLPVPSMQTNGLDQCIGTIPGAVYDLAGGIRLDVPVPDAVSVGLTCAFYDAADCQGTDLGGAGLSLVLENTGGQFQPFAASFPAPPGAWSARCGVVFDNSLGAMSFDGFVDPLFLGGPRVLFKDGFETGDTSRWTITVGGI